MKNEKDPKISNPGNKPVRIREIPLALKLDDIVRRGEAKRQLEAEEGVN